MENEITIKVEIGENLKDLLDTCSTTRQIQMILTKIFQSVSENADKFIVEKKNDKRTNT